MRITCPLCGERDQREFTWSGDSIALHRPAREAGPEVWDAYIHLRANPAGLTRDLWYHDACGGFVVLERDTVTHAIHSAALAREVAR